MGDRLTGIYLEDHHAVLVGAEELAKRMLSETEDAELRGLVGDALAAVRDDRGAVERLLGEVGRGPSRVKAAGAWLGEKAGRLKLNGNPTGYSPLTRLVELEGLALALEGTRAFWRALERAGREAWREDAVRRAERAQELLGRTEELRLVAADGALAGGGRRL